jgi:AraC-like DNA-binding protein/ligand-binding sensor protein
MEKKSQNNNHLLKPLQELEIINEIKEIFYANTGLAISIHYIANQDYYDFYPKKERNEFCRLIQSTAKGLSMCRKSDLKGVADARKQNGYAIYKCHAGLIDVVIPLVYRGDEIGAIYTGQVVFGYPGDEDFPRLQNLSNQLGIPFGKLKEEFLKVKSISKERLLSSVSFLSLMANYIIAVENELDLQRKISHKDKQLYINEREKIKLENELKNLTISVLEYNRDNTRRSSSKKAAVTSSKHIVSKAQLFIRSNYDKNIRLSDVAKAVCISPNYFCTLFRQLTGYTFSGYLLKTRMEAAEELLKTPDKPIKEIVSAVGFRDYNYFNRVFKKHKKGITPARFRKLAQKSILRNEKKRQKNI